MANDIFISILVVLLILSNWFVGFATAIFLLPKYEIKESLDFLTSHRMKPIKLIRSTEKLKAKSHVLKDNRSFIRKIYSTRSIHALIVTCDIEQKQKLIWIELLKTWNVLPTKHRLLNHHTETNKDVIKTLI